MPEASSLFLVFISPLNRLGLEYVVTGSVASLIYGEPRLTHDIDLVVNIPENSVSALIGAFPEDQFYCPPPEVIRIEAARSSRGNFNIIHEESGFKADFYLVGQDQLLAWAIRNKRSFELSGQLVAVAPPEYVILKKLEFYAEGKSEKHLRDISAILATSRELISFSWLEDQISKHGLLSEWQLAQKIGS